MIFLCDVGLNFIPNTASLAGLDMADVGSRAYGSVCIARNLDDDDCSVTYDSVFTLKVEQQESRSWLGFLPS